MYSTEAQYFDGRSSKLQAIKLSLNPNAGSLGFSISIWGGQRHLLSELHFECFNGKMEIRKVKESVEVVKLTDSAFIAQLNDLRKQHRSYSLYQRWVDASLGLHSVIALGILGVLVALYFYGMPALSEKAVDLLPRSYDEELGNGVLESFLLTSNIDSCKTESMALFVGQLEFPDMNTPIVTVVDSDVKNAFALPDGNIIVNTGILEIIDSPDELAALLGHETAHIYQRHSMKMLVRNLIGYVFISAVLSDVNGIMSVLAENAHNLQNMSYSRGFEQDADYFSLEFLRSNNLKTSGALDLFHHLQEVNEAEEYVPQLLSSHPLTKDRIEYLEAEINDDTLSVQNNEKLQSLFSELK